MKTRIRKTGEPLAFTPEEMDELIANAKQNPNIDWEQRRYELAKAAIPAVASGYNYYKINKAMINDIVKQAIYFADALIEELKNNK